jgi:ribonuclease HI
MALPAGKLGCNYDGEVVAIQAALQRLALQNPTPQKNLVVLPDSMATIQAISSPESQNSTIAEIRTLVHGIQINCEVMFQWIPSHCDLPGNDKADELAKAGASMKQPVTKIPLQTMGRKEWTTARRGKKWPKAQAKEEKILVTTAQFRLDTGHDLLGCHLKRFNFTKDNKCTLCNPVKSDRSHLFRCSAIKSDTDNLSAQLFVQEKEAHLYWLMHMKMASRP